MVVEVDDTRTSPLYGKETTAVMLCKDVKRVIYFFLDGSLGQSKLADVTTHVSHCSDCESRVTIQRKLRRFIQHRLAPVVAPPQFRDRLSRSLRATPVK